tara:strand:+ start:261 stop:911 length:651 start_codon:yes stop_codon:yes gene_type:complete
MKFFKRENNHNSLQATQRIGAKAGMLLACGYASLLLAVAPSFCYSQDTTQFNSYYSRLLDARLEEYKVSQPPRVLNFIPSVGASSIIVDGRVRVAPSISFSLSQFIRDKREQYRIEAKIRSIKQSTELEREEDLREVQKLQSEVESIQRELEIKSELLELKEKIFQYDSIRYSKNEIDPDAFYNSKISIISERYQIELIRQRLEGVRREINRLLRL